MKFDRSQGIKERSYDHSTNCDADARRDDGRHVRTHLRSRVETRVDAYRMIRRRTAEARFRNRLGCHVFRATGITAYLERGGTLENAQGMAAHESPRTTKLYDRTGDQITLDGVEKIQI